MSRICARLPVPSTRRSCRSIRLAAASAIGESNRGAREKGGELDGPKPKIWMKNLGCPKNQVDGEVMLGDLQNSGFSVGEASGVAGEEGVSTADVVVINTCTFIEDAKSESLDAIFDAAKKKKEGSKLVVTGCMAQRYAEELEINLPEADVISGFESYGELPAVLRETLQSKTKERKIMVGNNSPPFRSETQRFRLGATHSAYLRVAEGCDHSCSFCSIPGFRGRFRSKPFNAVIEEAQSLAKNGVREINLIAEDTNQYGMDFRKSAGSGLAELLHELAKIEGIEWLRILYAYPSYFSDDLIEAIATIPKVVKYIDMPLQHISNLMLLRMNRPHAKHTKDLLNKLRERIPGLVLRSTFIAGFPGESEEEHQEVLDFMKEYNIARGGCFSYSPEDGTPAADYPDAVAIETRTRWRDEVVALCQDLSSDYAASRVGEVVDVLIDSKNEDGMYVGRTATEAPDIDPVVFVHVCETEGQPSLSVGSFIKCRIVGSTLFDLEAEPIASV